MKKKGSQRPVIGDKVPQKYFSMGKSMRGISRRLVSINTEREFI